MTLVGDGRPGARQRETLHRRSSSPHSSDCAPRAPENPGSHCSRGGSPRPEMLSRVSGWGDPRAAVLHPRVPTALPRHPPPIYAAPVLFASLEVGNMGVQGPKSRKRRASQSFLGPKQNTQVTEEPLTCFPLWCLCLCSPTLHKPFQKGGGGESGGTREQRSAPNRLWLSGSRGAPAQPCAAERDVGLAGRGPLARPRNYWFLPRLVPFIDSAVPSAGVTTGQMLFSPSSPAPFPASVYVVQSLSRKHVEPRPAP